VIHHPDVHVPWQQWSEEQTLHLVSVYSNPFRSRVRRLLFNDFIRQIRVTSNVQLYIVELAYGDRPHEIVGQPLPAAESFRPVVEIPLRTSHELWHKENLINIGVMRIPPSAKYGGYSDGDFHYTRHDWALEAIHLLQHFDFVQLFSTYEDLSADHVPLSYKSTFARNYTLNRRSASPYRGAKRGLDFGSPGGGWAWKMPSFDKVGGMLESCILGSGDWHMAVGLTGEADTHVEYRLASESYLQAIRQWQTKAKSIEANIGVVKQHAIHHFHGSKSNRQYSTRPQILGRHSFNPFEDIKKDRQGVWQLTGNKPKLRDDIRKYFISRSEDDPSLYGADKHLL
jgi:hypothetical protein